MRQQIRSRRPMKAPTGAFPPNKSAGLRRQKERAINNPTRGTMGGKLCLGCSLSRRSTKILVFEPPSPLEFGKSMNSSYSLIFCQIPSRQQPTQFVMTPTSCHPQDCAPRGTPRTTRSKTTRHSHQLQRPELIVPTTCACALEIDVIAGPKLIKWMYQFKK